MLKCSAVASALRATVAVNDAPVPRSILSADTATTTAAAVADNPASTYLPVGDERAKVQRERSTNILPASTDKARHAGITNRSDTGSAT